MGITVYKRDLFYVLRKGGCLLSRTTITKLGKLPTTFPQVSVGGSQQRDQLPVWSATQGQVVVAGTPGARQPDGECDPDNPLPCSRRPENKFNQHRRFHFQPQCRTDNVWKT